MRISEATLPYVGCAADHDPQSVVRRRRQRRAEAGKPNLRTNSRPWTCPEKCRASGTKQEQMSRNLARFGSPFLRQTSRAAPFGAALLRSIRPTSLHVEPIKVHHLRPGGGEGVDEALLLILARIDLGQRAQLRVGAEQQIDAGRRPLDRAGVAVAPFV